MKSLLRMACAALCLAAAAAGADTDTPTPATLEIAPDVFMRDQGGRYGANQVFIVFDSFVVVFDPGRVPHARELVQEIRQRTDKPVRYVINSHFHPDHAAGAAVLAPLGAEVVAAAAARKYFEGWAREDFAAKVESEPAVYAGLAYAPPTRYLDERWTIDDGVQRLELSYHGPAHTTGDLVGWLPRVRVLLAGDLSTNGQHNAAGANFAGWIAALDELRGLEPAVVVPGHLELAGPEILGLSRRYLVELRAQVQDMVARGMRFEQVLRSVRIPFYEAWSGVPVSAEEGNVARVYTEVGGRRDAWNVSDARLTALLAVAGFALLGMLWPARRRRSEARTR